MSKSALEKENSFLRKMLNKFLGTNQENEQNKITYYGNKYGTDKISHHKYDQYYDLYLNRLYDEEGSIIEIGVEQGKSIEMWLKVFERAHIYGLDIGKEYRGKRYDVLKVDQSDKSQLSHAIQVMNTERVLFVIDDGSHIPEHQLLTFNMLFPLLMDGGVYIIEDVETSYWSKGGLYGYKTRYGYRHRNSIVEMFKSIADVVNKEFIKHKIKTPIKHLNSIHSITFGRNCIIINKRPISNRKYRFAQYL